MKRQPPTKRVQRTKTPDSLELLRTALRKRTKDELIEATVELARDSRATRRKLETRFKVQPPDGELVADTRQAIVDATDFDERDMNYNFDYDHQAYQTIQRNFGRMINSDRLDTVMELSLELMRQGSYQVEMSDEGLMTDDIGDCVRVVIRAIEKSDLPPSEVLTWCKAMRKSDRVGFICDQELKALKERFSG
ncbi:MAG: hypothetical protein L0Z07_03770 [Planctomycetes bacterium]|nr:hypothetical protein [Planctomycetota bacterium]